MSELETLIRQISSDCARWEREICAGEAGLTGAYGIMARASEELDILCALIVRQVMSAQPTLVAGHVSKIGRAKELGQFTLGERVRLIIGLWGEVAAFKVSAPHYFERCRRIEEHFTLPDTSPVEGDLLDSDCPYHVRNALWWLVRTRNSFVHGSASEMCESGEIADRRRDIGEINTLNFVRNLRDLVQIPAMTALSNYLEQPAPPLAADSAV